MDIDYLIETVFKSTELLDVERLRSVRIDWRIPITGSDNGHVRYVGKEEPIDTFELLRAAAAIPIFYGKKIILQQRSYIDGEVGPTIVDHVAEALRLGAK